MGGENDQMAAAVANLKTEANKTKNVFCGCFGLIIMLIVIGAIIGAFLPGSSSTSSDSYKTGHNVGFIDGNVAMQQGRLRESDEEKEAAAWSLASQFTGDSQEQKQDYVNGYKAGWDDGYTSH